MNNKLIEWYLQNKRDLPWRDEKDAYKVWISEVILQQTKVDQGISYYYRFLNRFPDINSLAAAAEDDVLRQWQGLGYYNRARNMHYTAKYIVELHNGVFPTTYQHLIKLKGVGDYIASAIASIVFNEPVAVVDGNVNRVISRLYMIDEPVNSAAGKRIIKSLAEVNLFKSAPGTYNEAIMELGALVCTPRKPHCQVCPLNIRCMALYENKMTDYPKKKGKQSVRERYFTSFIIVTESGKVAVRKRTSKDIWAGLYEFPIVETDDKSNIELMLKDYIIINGIPEGDYEILELSELFKHQLSHQLIYIRFILLRSKTDLLNLNIGAELVEIKNLPDLPFPRIFTRFTERSDACKKLEINL